MYFSTLPFYTAGIVDPAIGAFIELLRLETLGAADLHQVQLDVHAIRQTLSRCVSFMRSVQKPHSTLAFRPVMLQSPLPTVRSVTSRWTA